MVHCCTWGAKEWTICQSQPGLFISRGGSRYWEYPQRPTGWPAGRWKGIWKWIRGPYCVLWCHDPSWGIMHCEEFRWVWVGVCTRCRRICICICTPVDRNRTDWYKMMDLWLMMSVFLLFLNLMRNMSQMKVGRLSRNVHASFERLFRHPRLWRSWRSGSGNLQIKRPRPGCLSPQWQMMRIKSVDAVREGRYKKPSAQKRVLQLDQTHMQSSWMTWSGFGESNTVLALLALGCILDDKQLMGCETQMHKTMWLNASTHMCDIQALTSWGFEMSLWRQGDMTGRLLWNLKQRGLELQELYSIGLILNILFGCRTPLGQYYQIS